MSKILRIKSDPEKLLSFNWHSSKIQLCTFESIIFVLEISSLINRQLFNKQFSNEKLVNNLLHLEKSRPENLQFLKIASLSEVLLILVKEKLQELNSQSLNLALLKSTFEKSIFWNLKKN